MKEAPMVKRFFTVLGGMLLMAGLLSFPASASGLEPLALKDVSQISGRFYQNPLPVNNIGDPFILPVDGSYYAFATSSSIGFYAWASPDLTAYGVKKKALQRVSWANGLYWAPEVYAYGGWYSMVFSARRSSDNSLRIGIAFADKPQGPYKDPLDAPLFDFGYAAIDASLFVDADGTPYLYYARDCSENVVNGYHESHIYVVRLTEDLLSTVGEPVLLTVPEQAWELHTGDYRWNEGPAVVRHEGKYYLFYSGNYFEEKEYAVGVAVSANPMGPFEKGDANPLLSYVQRDGKLLVSGPGHNSFFTVGEELFTAYHTHTYPTAPSGNRQLCIDRAGFHRDGTAYINGPTLFAQLLPYSLLNVTNMAPAAALSVQGENPLALTDGDYCISSASDGYVFTGTVAELTYATPITADTVILYPGPAGKAKGTLVINGRYETDIDLSSCLDVPGACLIVHFDPMTVSSLRIAFGEAAQLGEIIVLGNP